MGWLIRLRGSDPAPAPSTPVEAVPAATEPTTAEQAAADYDAAANRHYHAARAAFASPRSATWSGTHPADKRGLLESDACRIARRAFVAERDDPQPVDLPIALPGPEKETP